MLYILNVCISFGVNVTPLLRILTVKKRFAIISSHKKSSMKFHMPVFHYFSVSFPFYR